MPLDDNQLRNKLNPLKRFFVAPIVEETLFRTWLNTSQYEKILIETHIFLERYIDPGAYHDAIMTWYRLDSIDKFIGIIRTIPPAEFENILKRLRPIAEDWFLYRLKCQLISIEGDLVKAKKMHLYNIADDPKKPTDPYKNIESFINFLESNLALITPELAAKFSFRRLFKELEQLPSQADKWRIYLQRKLSALRLLNGGTSLREFVLAAVKRFDFENPTFANWDYIKNATEQHLHILVEPAPGVNLDEDLKLYFVYIAAKLQCFKHHIFKQKFLGEREKSIITYNMIDAYVSALKGTPIKNRALDKLKEIIDQNFLPEFIEYNPQIMSKIPPTQLERTGTVILEEETELRVPAAARPAEASTNDLSLLASIVDGVKSDVDMTDSDDQGKKASPFPRAVSISSIDAASVSVQRTRAGAMRTISSVESVSGFHTRPPQLRGEKRRERKYDILGDKAKSAREETLTGDVQESPRHTLS